MKRRAVFIDRDGTISEEVGYINHASRFRLFPYAASAIKHLNENGWLAIVITNQAGVARGYFSEDMIQTVHAAMTKELESSGATTRCDLLLRTSSVRGRAALPFGLRLPQTKARTDLARGRRILISIFRRAGWLGTATAMWNSRETRA